MADRVETFDVTAPANTAQGSPVEVSTAFNPGNVRRVTIVIPDGHAGLTGIALAVAHQPVIPFNVKAAPSASWKFIEGNDEEPAFETSNYPDSGAWSAFVYNADTIDHNFQLRFEVDELRAAPAVSLVGSTPPILLDTTGATPLPDTTGGGELPSPPGLTPPPDDTTPGDLTPPGNEPPPDTTPPDTTPPDTGEPPDQLPPLDVPDDQLPPLEDVPVPGEPAATEPVEVAGGTEAPADGAPRRKAKPASRVTVVARRLLDGLLPAGARLTWRRIDQGQDIITDWRGPLIANGNGIVRATPSDRPFPNGFGPRYPVVYFTSGPLRGKTLYFGHCTSAVNASQRVRQGQVLCHADQGHIDGGGWAEIGLWPPGSMTAGAKIAGALRRTQIIRGKAPAKRPPARAGKRPPVKRTPPKGAPQRRVSPRAPSRATGGARAPGRPAPPARRAPSAAQPTPRPAPAPPRRAPAPPPPPPPRRAPAPPPRRGRR